MHSIHKVLLVLKMKQHSHYAFKCIVIFIITDMLTCKQRLDVEGEAN